MCKNIPDDDISKAAEGVSQSASVVWWFFGIFFFLMFVTPLTLAWFAKDNQPYYLACANRHGEELLLKTDKKPEIKYGLVFLDTELFTVPEQGMTCRVISVEEAEQEKSNKPVDKVI